MTVGWYVHHHGSGHLHRFLAVRDHLPGVVGLSSAPRPPEVPVDGWVGLPSDVPDTAPVDPTAHGRLHWVPEGVPGLRDRTAAIAAWVAAARPSVLVVDVSVEVALLGRLLSVPVVVVAQRGRRTDPAHRTGYACATTVVAPWTAASHAPGDGPPEDRLALVGAVSRFDGRPAAPWCPDGDVVFVVGAGGHALDAADVVAAAAATPGRRWHVAGALRVPGSSGVVDHGPRADVASLLDRAGVVVATAGGNAVAEVAAARRPLVLLPQDRPFDDQRRQAALLAAAGLAEAHDAWPAAEAWPDIVGRALARDPRRWAAHHDGDGAARFAAAVRGAAAVDGRGSPTVPSGGAGGDGAPGDGAARGPVRDGAPACA